MREEAAAAVAEGEADLGLAGAAPDKAENLVAGPAVSPVAGCPRPPDGPDPAGFQGGPGRETS